MFSFFLHHIYHLLIISVFFGPYLLTFHSFSSLNHQPTRAFVPSCSDYHKSLPQLFPCLLSLLFTQTSHYTPGLIFYPWCSPEWFITASKRNYECLSQLCEAIHTLPFTYLSWHIFHRPSGSTKFPVLFNTCKYLINVCKWMKD